MRGMRQGRAGGFTLMEIILAVLIFGLTMIAITTVMRTGTRSWSVGHGLSEALQSARLAQDVIVRDLNNLYYRTETEYNEGFRRQLDQITGAVLAQTDPRRGLDPRALEPFLPDERGARRDPADTTVYLDELTPPIDLSLVGTGGGETDRLTFTRVQTGSWAEIESGGVRRIKFYVRKGVLYREETDPYGYRPKDQMSPESFAMMQQNPGNPFGMVDQNQRRRRDEDPRNGSFEIDTAAMTQYMVTEELNRMFTGGDLWTGAEEGEDGAAASTDAEERGVFLPPATRYVEPLCEGVEAFDVSYGVFADGKWSEVEEWDSHETQHRSPFDEGILAELMGYDPRWGVPTPGHGMLPPMRSRGGARNESMFNNPMLMGMLANREPDDLPGYIAIRLTVKVAELKGRPYTFTIFHSVPGGLETDKRMSLEELETMFGGMVDIDPRLFRDRERETRSGRGWVSDLQKRGTRGRR